MTTQHEPQSARILDEQTGVYSIEYLEHQLKSLVAFALRRERPISIILFTVDYMEELQATFGPEAFRHVLIEVARLVRGHIRDEDVLARYGAGEFAVLCTDTPIHAAGLLAKRIRQAVESADLTHRGVEIPATISLGVATLSPSADEHSAMVQEAEVALARARSAGNCLVVSEPVS